MHIKQNKINIEFIIYPITLSHVGLLPILISALAVCFEA